MKSDRKRLYTYKGFSYRPEVLEDLKKDTYQVVHWVEDQHLDGREFTADFTKYHKMSRVDFENYVNLKCPRAPGETKWTPVRLREVIRSNEDAESFINKFSKKIKEGIKSAARKTRNPRMPRV